MGKYLVNSIPMLRNNKKQFSKLNIIKNKIKKILQSKKFNGKNFYI